MKGNMLLGHARGSVGDVVFARYKGQQTAHSRARSPQNPKTVSQMMQRSLFVDVNKFYTRGVQNLFKFAFENKKDKESDFNAFMRYNTQYGVRISQKAFNEPTYPALGNFMMSQGSLKNLPLEYTDDNLWKFRLLNMTNNTPTVKAFSQAMIDAYECKEGDFFTLLVIASTDSDRSNTPAVDPEVRGQVIWYISQIKLDLKNENMVGTYIKGTTYTPREDYFAFSDLNSDYISAACVMLSRNSTKGVSVNNSYLILNDEASYCIAQSKEQSYIDEVMASWNANDKSILQGNI